MRHNALLTQRQVILKSFLIILGIPQTISFYDKSFKVKYIELFKANGIIKEGAPCKGTEIIIDEIGKKITVKSPEEKNQIFRIYQKKKVKGESNIYAYNCEFKNNNGIIFMGCYQDVFYQTFTVATFEDLKKENGNYVKHYYDL